MSDRDRRQLPERSSRADIDAFLRQVAALSRVKPTGRRGRLIFAMDATASRERTWDRASHIQSQMFQETASLGGLEIQLCFYRGYREFETSPWLTDTGALQRQMTAVSCAAGYTQIERILAHTLEETRNKRVNALVFVGDCMEEDPDRLSHLAGQLGALGVPGFVFQEGDDPIAERSFRQIARLSKGAYCRFDAQSASQLRDLLSAVAVYASGGRQALDRFATERGGIALQLTHEIDER
ncbi:MAG: VWA domain-containing protein [Gammaproteobacteria bacterium]